MQKKFQYKLIKSGARTSQYGDAIDWLIRAGIVNKCMKCSQGFYPVAAYQDVSAFKLYYSDLGIMSARLGMTLEALQGKETEHFRGILTENYVAIALKTNGYDLYYWESDNRMRALRAFYCHESNCRCPIRIDRLCLLALCN